MENQLTKVTLENQDLRRKVNFYTRVNEESVVDHTGPSEFDSTI